MTGKITRMKLKYSEFNTVPAFFCAEIIFCSTWFFLFFFLFLYPKI